jgi:hypothetical protein
MTAFIGFVKDDGTLTLDAPAAFRAFYRRFAGDEIEVGLIYLTPLSDRSRKE